MPKLAVSSARTGWGRDAVTLTPEESRLAKRRVMLSQYGRRRFKVRLKGEKEKRDGIDVVALPESIESILELWDKGTKQGRRAFLKAFNAKMQGDFSPNLEVVYGPRVSLLLSRVISWLRLTYTLEVSAVDQLTLIHIFITYDTESGLYLEHYTESGGLKTAVDIISHARTEELQKLWAMKVLRACCKGGKIFKELMCENDVVTTVVNASNDFKSTESLKTAKNLLVELGLGNPAHSALIHEEILSTLPRKDFGHECKIIFVMVLEDLFSPENMHNQKMKPDARYVKLIVTLFTFHHDNLHLASYDLLLSLIEFHGLEDVILQTMLDKISKEMELADTKAMADKYVMKRCATVMIGKMALLRVSLARKIVRRKGVQALLRLLTLTDSSDLVQEVGETLKILIFEQVPEALERVSFVLGPKLFMEFKIDTMAMIRQFTGTDLMNYHQRLNSQFANQPILELDPEEDAEWLLNQSSQTDESDRTLNESVVGNNRKKGRSTFTGGFKNDMMALMRAAKDSQISTLYARSNITAPFAQRAGRLAERMDKLESEVDFQEHIKDIELNRQERERELTRKGIIHNTSDRNTLPSVITEPINPHVQLTNQPQETSPRQRERKPPTPKKPATQKRSQQKHFRQHKHTNSGSHSARTNRKQNSKPTMFVAHSITKNIKNQMLSNKIADMRLAAQHEHVPHLESKGLCLVSLAHHHHHNHGAPGIDPTKWGISTMKARDSMPAVAKKIGVKDFNGFEN